MKVIEQELSENLELLFRAEERIKQIIEKGGLRFSINKMTGDLGEFYAYRCLSRDKRLFDSVEPQLTSNAEYDLLGRLSTNSALRQEFSSTELRIEVKTRRNQKGVKFLSRLKPDKFDLLCVVDIAKNYALNKVCLVKSETALHFLDRKYQRLIFKESMAFMAFPVK